MITHTMSWIEAVVLVGTIAGAGALLALIREAQKDIDALRQAEIENGRSMMAHGERRGEVAKFLVILLFVAQTAYQSTRPEPHDLQVLIWSNVWKGAYIIAIAGLVADSILRLRERRAYLTKHMAEHAAMDGANTGPLYPHQVDGERG